MNILKRREAPAPVITADALRAISHKQDDYAGPITLGDFIDRGRAVSYWTVPWMLDMAGGILVLPDSEITAEEKEWTTPHGTCEMRVEVSRTGFVTAFLPESKRSELGRLNKRGSENSGGIPVNAVKFEDRGWNATTWVRAD